MMLTEEECKIDRNGLCVFVGYDDDDKYVPGNV